MIIYISNPCVRHEDWRAVLRRLATCLDLRNLDEIGVSWPNSRGRHFLQYYLRITIIFQVVFICLHKINNDIINNDGDTKQIAKMDYGGTNPATICINVHYIKCGERQLDIG